MGGCSKTKLVLISTQVEVVVEVEDEQDVAVIEAGVYLSTLFLTDYGQTDRRDNNAISALSCSCS